LANAAELRTEVLRTVHEHFQNIHWHPWGDKRCDSQDLSLDKTMAGFKSLKVHKPSSQQSIRLV